MQEEEEKNEEVMEEGGKGGRGGGVEEDGERTMETSQARLYAGPHVQSSDRLRRKEPNRGDKQLFLVSLVSDPTPQIAATPANRRVRRRSDRGKKTASIDSATFSHCADGHRETPSGCWFPTTSSSSSTAN